VAGNCWAGSAGLGGPMPVYERDITTKDEAARLLQLRETQGL